MRVLVVTALVVGAGCGRYQFDALTDGADPDVATCTFTFCDDFADGAQPAQRWDGYDGMGMPSIEVSGGVYKVELDATGERAFLVKSFAAPTTSVTVHARIGWTIDNAGTDCELDLVALKWQSGTCAAPFGFYLVRDGTNPFNLQETNGNATCNGDRQNYQGVLDNTGLHDVTMTATIGAAGVARIQMVLDGTIVVDRATLQALPSAPLELSLGGVLIRNGVGTWTITYDDVYVDVQ